MVGMTKIENSQAVSLSNTKILDNNIEIHIPVASLSGQHDRILKDCLCNYMDRHKNVTSTDELFLDAQIVISCDGFCGMTDLDYSLFVTIWQVSDELTGINTTEYYGYIPVSFGGDETKQIKQTVWNALGLVLSNI